MKNLTKIQKLVKFIFTKETFVEILIGLSPSKGHWMQLNRSKFLKSSMIKILNDPKLLTVEDTQLTFFPKEFYENQLEKVTINMEWSSKDENVWKDELRKLWKNFLELYLKELNQQILTEEEEKKRLELMKKFNPIFCLRNYLLEQAIVDAKKDNYKKVNDLLKLCENPFDRHLAESMPQYFGKQPDWAENLSVSCSS